MTKTDVALKERFMEQFDLTPLDGRRCLSRLVGQRCMANVGPGGNNARCDGCGKYRRVLDHVSMWRHLGGSFVLVAQPYDVDLHAAEALAQKHWLCLRVSDELSWHLPGSTTLLMFGRPEAVFPDGTDGDR